MPKLVPETNPAPTANHPPPPSPRPHPACDTKPQTRQRREIETYEREKIKKKMKHCNRMRKMKMAKRKTQRSAKRGDATRAATLAAKNQNVDEKVENLRKVTKCYISSLATTTTTTTSERIWDGSGGLRVGPRPGPGQDRRAANRKTPFCSAACRLMRLQQMRRLPAVHHFCFLFSSLTHTQTQAGACTDTSMSTVCVCVWHAYCDISCGFRQFTTKCQE